MNNISVATVNPDSTGLVTLQSTETSGKFSPHAMGYRATCLEATGKTVVALYSEEGRTDSQVVAKAPQAGRLQLQRSGLVADAICHALNAGMSLGELQDIVNSVSQIVERADFSYASNVAPIGLFIDSYPAVRYVMRVADNQHNALVVRPDIRTEVTPLPELVRSCER